ncbi:CHAT domain-containing protein [Streptomyces sp. NPDC055796]
MPAAAHPLRAARDEVTDALAAVPAGSAEAQELYGQAGELGYRLYVEQADPEDRDLAAESFAHAFRRRAEGPAWPLRRIMYGHLLALRHDERPGRELAAEIHTLLARGLPELPEEAEHDGTAVLARWLLAYITKRRVMDGPGEPALLDEALRWGLAALDDTDGEDADLLEALGFLWQRHALATGDTASYTRSADHYARVLAAGDRERDLPLARLSRATSLMLLGHHTADRAVLEEARDEILRALAEAGGSRPSWEREARVRAAFTRVAIATTWSERSEGDRAAAELTALLTAEADIDALPWFHLDWFGRFLVTRVQQGLDPEALDLAIALLTRAVDRWEPAEGKVTRTALALVTAQHLRYLTDQDPARLSVMERAGQLALEGEELPSDVRDLLLLTVADARHRQGKARSDTLSGEELMRIYRDFREHYAQGESPDFTFDEILYGEDSPARGAWERRFSELFDSWRATEHASERAELAAHLLQNMVFLDPGGDRIGPEREAELTGAVLAYADENPAWRGHGYAVLGNHRLAQGMLNDNAARLAEAVEHFAEAARAGNDSPWLTHGATIASGMLAQLHGITSGVVPDQADWDRLRSALSPSPKVDRLLRLHQAGARAGIAVKRGDLAEADRLVAEVARAVGEGEADDPGRIEAWAILESARMVRNNLAGRLGVPLLRVPEGRPSTGELLRLAAKLPRGHRAGLIGGMALAWKQDALVTADLPRIRETLALSEEAVRLSEPGGETWIRFTSEAGSVYCTLVLAGERAHSPQRAHDLERAISLLEGAVAAMGGPEHRLWAVSLHSLAQAYRIRSAPDRRDRERGRRLGLEAMRGFVCSALLQSGTQDAAEAARLATGLSEEVVGWCVADRASQDALQALDACRGLVLHAATTSRSVPELLTAAGRDALAAEWHAAGAADDPDSAPGDLRRRVVRALTEARTPLLDPPSPEEIGGALRAQGKDALVYLVAATADCPGTAVVVTSRGEVRGVRLPNLRADAGPLRAYRPGQGTAPRDIEPVPGHGPARPDPAPPLRDRLDRLCSWAWRTALRPLLGRFEVLGRVPRLVLVPMGPLGLVPWHAAFGDTGTGRRYALQDAEISYAASARLLCEVAARPGVPHTGTALVVGDPTGDLPYAGEEADAVRRAFYPAGEHLGLRSGDGTPGEVSRWLRERADGGAVLHLACHGTVEENGPRSSYLALKGGVLTAEELTGAVHGPLGLVVLAACRSQVSGRGLNEAYSLSSAFLVAGSRSVIGSLWPVPDDATSVLMFLTHHYLRREQEPPARALRRAQLWMLDPDRSVPEGMPPALTARLAHLDPHDLTGWAGFTHLGQ